MKVFAVRIGDKYGPEYEEYLEDKLSDVMDSIQVQREERTSMEEIEGLILPLLYNLLKNPEREYICWPNRTEVIQKQIDKILAVTRK